MVRYWQWIKKGLFAWRSNKSKSTESNLCDYSDVYILVTANITVPRTVAAAGNEPFQRNQPLAADTQVAFNNCGPFKNFRTEINITFVWLCRFC